MFGFLKKPFNVDSIDLNKGNMELNPIKSGDELSGVISITCNKRKGMVPVRISLSYNTTKIVSDWTLGFGEDFGDSLGESEKKIDMLKGDTIDIPFSIIFIDHLTEERFEGMKRRMHANPLYVYDEKEIHEEFSGFQYLLEVRVDGKKYKSIPLIVERAYTVSEL